MAKYMVQASYVGEGLKGLLKEGGSKRRDTVAQVIEAMGGKFGNSLPNIQCLAMMMTIKQQKLNHT